MTEREIQHLYWRAGFGITASELSSKVGSSRKTLVKDLMNESKRYKPLRIDLSEIEGMMRLPLLRDKDLFRQFLNKSKEKIKDLNIAWYRKLCMEDDFIREKMTLFWANHFVVRDNNVFFLQKYNNTLRNHALGNFRDLVKAISKEPSMLKFLNNIRNVKGRPNENFSRELMELFTIGEGNYSESDIKEAARAFTGYSHDRWGNFVLKERMHDSGNKMFFGNKGKFDGDDIIDIILSQPQCAKFICEKIYKNFVNEDLNEDHINSMVERFYPKYRIGELMKFLFLQDWFYNSVNMGSKIKSPIELLVGIYRTVPYHFNDKKQLLAIQRLMGQVIFDPPNVAGWAGGRSWIDSNSMLFRMRVPSLLLNGAYISHSENRFMKKFVSKEIKRKLNERNPFNVSSNWKVFEKAYDGVSVEMLNNNIVQSDINKGTFNYLNELEKGSKRDHCIQLMSLPEYQLC